MKLTAGLGLAFLVALWALNELSERNADLRQRIEQRDQLLKTQTAVLTKERAESLAASLRSAFYQQQRAKADEDFRRLELCIADKSCVPRVRVYTTCPAVPGAPADPAGAVITSAELGEDSRRLVLQLKRDVRLMTDRYLWMQRELKARGP